MDKDTFEKHKPFAGKKKLSMLLRRVGHDYQSRRIYLITMTVEGRRPLLGTLVGDAYAPNGSPEEPRVELSPLGDAVQRCWLAIGELYPAIEVLATMVMPDHLHGILFVRQHMEQHLSMAIKGFKVGCNRAFRQLGYAATPLQQNNKNDRRHGFLWARGFNDHILEGVGELGRWLTYLSDNPRRLAVRRSHPEYFRVSFGITVGSQSYAAIGNRFLLQHPEKVPVQCSRSLTDDKVAAVVERMLDRARHGAVLVSPGISKGEQAVMRAALNACLPIIFLTPWGFNEFSKPGHQFFEACAEGRFLILAPWPHENRRIPLTRDMCLALNAMTAAICHQ